MKSLKLPLVLCSIFVSFTLFSQTSNLGSLNVKYSGINKTGDLPQFNSHSAKEIVGKPAVGRRQGTFGIGVNPILSFSNYRRDNSSKLHTRKIQTGAIGIVTYNATTEFSVNFGLGFTSKSEEESWTAPGDPSRKETISGFTITIGFLYAFHVFKNDNQAFDLGVGATAILVNGKIENSNTNSGTTTSQKDDYKSSNIGLIIQPEWFVSEHFSIHAQVGIGISILNEDNTSYSEGGVNVHVFETGNLLGQAGFTFWF